MFIINKHHTTPHYRYNAHVIVVLCLLLTGALLSCGDDPNATGGTNSDYCDTVTTTKSPTTTAELTQLITEAIGLQGDSPDLNYIDTSQITDMESMFANKNNFNGNIVCWDVSGVTKMDNMFNGADAFNQDISNWDVSSVITMVQMFKLSGATSATFNQDISSWDISSVTDMSNMFRSASNFCQNLELWGDNQNIKENTVTTTGMFVNTGTKCSPAFTPPSWYQ